MYIPKHHRIDDRATQIAFMRAHSFATVVTAVDGRAQATHLALVVVQAGDDVRLLAHMARQNPQWRDFGDGREALVIFMAPHAYVSPQHYERAESVPTWNYAAVHAYGIPRIIEGRSDKHAMMLKLIALHDADYLARFPDLPPDYVEKMLAGVVAFEIPVTRFEARFKLSQEKLPVERARIAAALDASGDSAAAETARLMRAHGE